MGRPFNENEKEKIRCRLLEKGKQLFSSKGLKKTSVGQLTQLSGIAQGSFYAFFNSKEELYFDILESEEKKMSEIIEKEFRSIQITREDFKQFLKRTIDLVIGNPFLRVLINENEYRALIVKIPQAKFQNHLQAEYQFTYRLINRFQEQKHMKPIKPEVLSGIFHSLFLLHLHQDEIGIDVFPQVLEFLIDIIADTLINHGKLNFDVISKGYSK